MNTKHFSCCWTFSLSLLVCLSIGSVHAAPTNDKGTTAALPKGNTKIQHHLKSEDWTTPKLSGSHLQPTLPVVAESDDRPKFTREMVEVGWRPLDSFHLFVIKPKGIVNPPVVLYLYNYDSDTRRFLNDSYCERITRSGCAAVGFESALSGDRFQMRPMKQWFVSELPEALAESAHDVQMILNYLSTRGDLDMRRVGIFGQGSGGAIAILAAGADPRIKSLDLLNPWANWPVWLKSSQIIPEDDRKQLTRPEFVNQVAGLEPLKWLSDLSDRKIRIIQVSDDVTPVSCQEALAKAAPKGTQILHFDNNINLFGSLGHGKLFVWQAKQLNARPAPITTSATGLTTTGSTNMQTKQ